MNNYKFIKIQHNFSLLEWLYIKIYNYASVFCIFIHDILIYIE